MRIASIRLASPALALVAGALLSAAPAYAYVYSSEAQWASWSQGAWTIYNDVWGNPNPSQWLNVSSINQWNVSSNQTGGGVKSYPNTVVVPNTPLSNMQSATGYFAVASPSNSVYSWFFDVYTSSGGTDQIQVYEQWTTPTGGWGKQIYSNVTVGASTWSQVWQASQGSNNVLMFFRSGQRTSGYEDLLAITKWCQSHGILKNANFYSMSFGVEITSTSGWQSFYLNGYSASWSNTSGGGSGI
jgi:hypothetical protein